MGPFLRRKKVRGKKERTNEGKEWRKKGQRRGRKLTPFAAKPHTPKNKIL